MAVGETGTTLGGRLTFGGLATGLDTSSLIRTLLAVEARPLIRMEDDLENLEDNRKKYQELNSKLLDLRNKARALDNRTPSLGLASLDEELLEFQATSNDENVLTASATGDAVPGTYDMIVGQLASAGREFSIGFATQDTALGYADGESLSIDYGGTDPIDINVGSSTTLLQIRDAINTDTNNQGNVQASVLFDGTDYHLIVAGTATGAANDVTITESAGVAGFIDAAAEAPGQDAVLQIFGFNVTRESNEITDVLEGVTLKLRGVSAGVVAGDPPDLSAATVTEVEIATDVTAIADKLREFTDAFNDIRDFIETNAKFDTDTQQARAFTGDATTRTIDQVLQTTLVQAFTFQQFTTFQGLSEIGVSFNGDGRLTVDEQKLEEALIEDVASVKRLLGGDPDEIEDADNDGEDDDDGVTGRSGVMTALANVLEPLTRSGDGTLAIRDDAFEVQIEGLETRIDRFERLLESREEALIAEYSALESSIAALQSQQSFLFALGG